MAQTDRKFGDIVNNGHYNIRLESKPWNIEGTNRWIAWGYRWVPSRKAWDTKLKRYGWHEQDESEAAR